MSDTPQSKGGKARSNLLSKEERTAIARAAAHARWEEPCPKALYGELQKPIRIADIEVPCYVLDDQRRVITASGMQHTLNMAPGGAMIKGMNRLQLFAAGKFIRPYVSNELFDKLEYPIKFKIGSKVAYGFESDTLIDLAESVIAADNAEPLQKQQSGIVHVCRVITKSLTRIGLVALIDEATGYQSKREKDELQQILTAYLLPEHRPWIQTIPSEFTDEVFRVYGWKRRQNNQGPRYAGKLIRKLIYEKLPAPVLPALDEMNPVNLNNRRKKKHFQFLTEKQGLDHFRSQVITVMTLLRISKNKDDFTKNLGKFFGPQMEFDFEP